MLALSDKDPNEFERKRLVPLPLINMLSERSRTYKAVPFCCKINKPYFDNTFRTFF
jgi:hypothetical protein